MSSEISIKVENLSKCYQIYDQPRDRLKQFIMPRLRRSVGLPQQQYFREFWALKDVSFEVKRGETVGIIGRNGSGKSTILQMICGTLNPTGGSIQTNGRIAALLELGSGFNPEFTGRENVYMNAAVLGLSKEEIDQRFDDIVAFADIGEFLDQPVKTFSSGMYVRLAFSVIVHVDADILVVDEALAVGDAFFQAKCATRLNRIVEKGTTLLFVSHDISAVKAMCKRTLWLDKGVCRGFGDTATVAKTYAQEWVAQANAQHLLPITDEAATAEQKDVTLTEDIGDSKALQFSMRSGNGHAQYMAFKGYCNNEPIDLLPLEFGSNLRLRCSVKILESCERLIVSFHIKDKNNQHLIGANTAAMLGLYDRIWQAGERFQVEFTLPVRLQAGRYSVTALISSISDIKKYSDAIFMDWVEDICVFEVAPRIPFPLSDWIEIEHEVKFSLS